MDPTAAANVPGWIDKYGPMGCALIVVSVAFLAFVWKVLPLVTESHGKRLDAIVDAFKVAVGGFNKRMDEHESIATDRHGEIISKLDKIDEKIPEPKHKKDGGP